MDLSLVDLTPDQAAFQADVRSFLDELMTEDVYAHEHRTGDGFNEGVHLALGKRGWLFPEEPAPDGTPPLDQVEQRILNIEMTRREVPYVTMSTTALVWSSVKKFLDPELLADMAPKVRDGRVRFALGYTEPDGGSDIAAAKTRAVRDGDEWIINGAKMFTTGAHNCQYTFLITRTDPELPKHKGLTMFLVPLDSPGVDIQAIRTFGGERTNAVYFGDVLLDDRYRLGGVNAGWSVLREPLDAEHALDAATGFSEISGGVQFSRLLDRVLDVTVEWAQTATVTGGGRASEDGTVLEAIGRAAMASEVGRVTPGPMGRINGSDLLGDQAAALLDVVGPQALLDRDAEGAIGEGLLDFAHRFAQGTGTYGGTVEVFRTIVAQHVLGLPRPSFPGSTTFLQKSKTSTS